MDIKDLPEWPADQPLPDDAVTVIGAKTVEEAQAFLRQQREAEAIHCAEAEERARRRQERDAADAKRRSEISEGLAKLGRGEVSSQPKPAGRRGPKVDTLVAMAAGYALCLRDDGRDNGEIPGRPAAVAEAITQVDPEKRHGLKPGTVQRHLEIYEDAER
jgi:hypothetical protein